MNTYIKKIGIVIVLVLILIAMSLVFPNGKIASNTISGQNPGTVNDENFDQEVAWATSGGEFPVGWEQTSINVGGTEYQKIGPVGNTESYIILVSASSLPLLDENRKCVGDSESSLCAIGSNADVARYFNIVTYRD